MNSKPSSPLQFPEVVVAEASAGSGKTYALAKRFLQLIFSLPSSSVYGALRTILAITFTNKATVEMKERILELLKKIAFDAFVTKEERDIFNLLGKDKAVAQKQAYQIIEAIICHYNFFQVQTIDSFINALLLGCALKIDRSAHFKIKKTYSQHLSYCLDLVIDEAASDAAVYSFFEEFLEHYLFVENRGGWFPKEDILELMRSLFSLSNKYGQLFQVYEGESKDVIARKKYIYNQIQRLAMDFPADMKKNAKKYISSFLDKNQDIFDIADLPQGLRESNVPMKKGRVSPPAFEKKWKKVHRLLSELIDLDAAIAYNPYVKLFQTLLEFFQRVSRREDVLFLEELNRKARYLFDEEGITVAELYYRLATRFKHYLIDEFQDTSVLQWRNLELMVEEALSTGGSLFYVGDKKQAIYRFRGGEAGLFDAVRERFRHFNIHATHLIKNWRSQKAIVEFNNHVFSSQNLRRALLASKIEEELGNNHQAVEEIVGVFKDAIQQYRKGNAYGYVEVHRLDEKNQHERNELLRPKILSLLSELRQRFRYEDIVLLARDNSEVELLTSWLLEAHIPVESEKTLNVIENRLVKEIISFLKFLHSPIDNLNFAAFILGEMFSHVTQTPHDEMTDFLFELRQKRKNGENKASLYRLFRKRYPVIWHEYFDEFFKNVGFVSPYELISSIYQRFAVTQHFPVHQAFLMKFLELVKSKEEEYVGLGELFRYLNEAPSEELYVTVTHSDSVRVLTIHKSKGLEFGVVIIPFLRIDISPETGGKGTSSYVAEEQRGSLLRLLRITKVHRSFSPHLLAVYHQAYQKACIDELNNIYVALTRARYELYIFIPRRSGSRNNKVRYIIPQSLNSVGEKKVYERRKQESGQPLIEMSPSFYKDWMTVLHEERDISSVRNREKIIQGTVAHYILSCIDNLSYQDEKQAIQRAFAAARLRFPFFDDFPLLFEKITLLLQNSQCRPFFYIGEGHIFKEKEVVSTFGDTKRIDRLIVRKGAIDIVDYKLSHDHQETHREQVAEYIAILKEIYPHSCLRGYLIYLDTMERKEVVSTEG